MVFVLEELRGQWGKNLEVSGAYRSKPASGIRPSLCAHDGLLTKRGGTADLVVQVLRGWCCQISAWESQGGPTSCSWTSCPCGGQTRGLDGWLSSPGLSIYFFPSTEWVVFAPLLSLPTFSTLQSRDCGIQALGSRAGVTLVLAGELHYPSNVFNGSSVQRWAVDKY